jgi:hypothetical protein
MSNYTKSTNFAAKDALASGNAAKIVKGTEIDTEFNNIATAVATKADSANPTFTGTVTMPTGGFVLTDGSVATTQTFGNSSTLVATTAFVQAALGAMYPVGSIYTNAAVSTNPATLLGFGTWVAFGPGRVLIGVDASDAAFDTLGETGGSKDAVVVSHTHTATVTDPGHKHTFPTRYDFTGGGSGFQSPYNGLGTNVNSDTTTVSTGISVSNSTTGSSGTNANLQPYVTVYMWRRTV